MGMSDTHNKMRKSFSTIAVRSDDGNIAATTRQEVSTTVVQIQFDDLQREDAQDPIPD